MRSGITLPLSLSISLSLPFSPFCFSLSLSPLLSLSFSVYPVINSTCLSRLAKTTVEIFLFFPVKIIYILSLLTFVSFVYIYTNIHAIWCTVSCNVAPMRFWTLFSRTVTLCIKSLVVCWKMWFVRSGIRNQNTKRSTSWKILESEQTLQWLRTA